MSTEIDDKQASFAHWILGYQGFNEPIVRDWLESQGMEHSPSRLISRDQLRVVASRLRTKKYWPKLDDDRRNTVLSTLAKRSRQKRARMQLDILAKSEKGWITGEIKSWGGSLKAADWELVEFFFVKQDYGLFLCIDEIENQPVVESVLVLWERSLQHDLIESKLLEIYGRPVKLYYVKEILRPQDEAIKQILAPHRKKLEQAVHTINEMFDGVATPAD